jgi:restriction endonuclease Mrr
MRQSNTNTAEVIVGLVGIGSYGYLGCNALFHSEYGIIIVSGIALTAATGAAIYATRKWLKKRHIAKWEATPERVAIRKEWEQKAEIDRLERCRRNEEKRLIKKAIFDASPAGFEQMIADKCNGHRIGRTGDHGVDIIVERGMDRIAIQCKKWNSSVGNSAVQEVFTGAMIHRCNKHVVVTSSYFTPAAIAAAKATGTILIDGNKLATGKLLEYI